MDCVGWQAGQHGPEVSLPRGHRPHAEAGPQATRQDPLNESEKDRNSDIFNYSNIKRENVTFSVRNFNIHV